MGFMWDKISRPALSWLKSSCQLGSHTRTLTGKHRHAYKPCAYLLAWTDKGATKQIPSACKHNPAAACMWSERAVSESWIAGQGWSSFIWRAMHIRNPRFRVEEIWKVLFAVSDRVNELGAGKGDGTLWCTGLENLCWATLPVSLRLTSSGILLTVSLCVTSTVVATRLHSSLNFPQS